MGNAEDLNTLKDRLAGKYPDWHFWVSTPDSQCTATLMATRIEHVTDGLIRAGLYRTLPWGLVGHAPSLEDQLKQQTEKAIEIGHYPAKVLL